MIKNAIISLSLLANFNTITVSMENRLIIEIDNNLTLEQESCCCCSCNSADTSFLTGCITGITLRSVFPDELLLPYAIATCIGIGTYTLNKKLKSENKDKIKLD
jgi:hypothetical protein